MSVQGPIASLSVVRSDLSRLNDTLRLVDPDFDQLHFEISDGTVVPRESMLLSQLSEVRAQSFVPADVHLLMRDPGSLLEVVQRAGASTITITPEAVEDPLAVLKRIRELGVRCGVAWAPAESSSRLEELLPYVDQVLVWTTDSRWDGPAFIPEAVPRITWLCEQRKRLMREFRVAAKGRLGLETTRTVTKAGADILIYGEAVFAAQDPAFALAMLRSAMREMPLSDSPDGVTPLTEEEREKLKRRVFYIRR